MTQPRPERRQGQPAGASVAVRDEDASDGTFCTCCDPRNPLVMRPDFGVLGDGSPEYALCVLHEPEPRVYRNRGDGLYVQMPDLSLSAAGDLVDREGNVIARVAGEGFQRLSTVDDDDDPPGRDPGGGRPSAGPAGSPGGASRPATYHVDLSQDDFYR
jgi:hypothetical protein